jgi:sulfur-carrier protein adenylyltransferase/sulfurtransferase
MLNTREKAFYGRQILLTEIGEAGQEKLKLAKVLVIGAGGLGCPVLTYLAAAGVGNIGVMDADIIDESNLHRQVLYGVSHISKPKTEAAIERLQDLNPHIGFDGYFEKLTPGNALEIIKKYDLVVDATDNFPTRYLINDACVILNKPFVSGSIDRFQGQVAVLNFEDKNGVLGPTYRCVFPEPPKPESAPNCSQIGVIGVLPGIIGSFQANEIIKIITGYGEVLSGKLFILDTALLSSTTIKIKRNPEMVERALSIKNNLAHFDYNDFCHLKRSEIIEIDSADLQKKLDQKEILQIVDLREDSSEVGIGGALKIPYSKFHDQINRIDKNDPVLLFCQYGIRSIFAADVLIEAGYKKVFNLTGGLMAWKNDLERVKRNG